MPAEEPTSFNDPELKRICCFAWSKECCTVHLRAKLAAAMSDERDSDGNGDGRTIRPPAAFWQRPFAGVAAAAVVLLVSGVVIFTTGSGSTALASLDPQLASDLVTRHDLCCTGHGSHQMPGLPQDLSHLGQALSEKLHRPVLAAALPEMGWSLRGGSICPVGKTPAAHLIFDHGKEAVSVFSLPARSYDHPGNYQASVNHHSIAGFSDTRGTFCLVGSDDAAITPQYLAALRDQMESNVVMNAAFAPRESVAELLH